MALKLNPPGKLGVLVGLLGAALAHGAPLSLPADLTAYGAPAVYGLVLAYATQRLVSWGVNRVVRSIEELPGKVSALSLQFDALTAQIREHRAVEEERLRGVMRRLDLLEQDVRTLRRPSVPGA